MLDRIIERVSEFKEFFKQPMPFRLQGSSLFFVYDSENQRDTISVHLIDFGNVEMYKNGAKQLDTGFITSMESLLERFQTVKANYVEESTYILYV